MLQQLSKIFIFIGIIFITIGLGLILWAKLAKIPILNQLGKLPGDIYIKRGNYRFYFPIITSILISIIISLIFYFFNKK